MPPAGHADLAIQEFLHSNKDPRLSKVCLDEPCEAFRQLTMHWLRVCHAILFVQMIVEYLLCSEICFTEDETQAMRCLSFDSPARGDE